MLEHYFGLIEALFVFGLAVAFYIWQMRDLKKENAKARKAEKDRPPENSDNRSEGP
ncbi:MULTISPECIES: hypothetical protein [unclassified Rhizobium]|uniref:hypothetical protein n=1 Tax=unclassified Rhizobium TaxID=2613769 RepID=UPI000A7360B0|nr:MULTISPECIES: hypothetical protein [unclassified Rhizobium]